MGVAFTISLQGVGLRGAMTKGPDEGTGGVGRMALPRGASELWAALGTPGTTVTQSKLRTTTCPQIFR